MFNIQFKNGLIYSNLEMEFDWEKSTQGYLLSTFFYGYICTQIIGVIVCMARVTSHSFDHRYRHPYVHKFHTLSSAPYWRHSCLTFHSLYLCEGGKVLYCVTFVLSFSFILFFNLQFGLIFEALLALAG